MLIPLIVDIVDIEESLCVLVITYLLSNVWCIEELDKQKQACLIVVNDSQFIEVLRDVEWIELVSVMPEPFCKYDNDVSRKQTSCDKWQNPTYVRFVGTTLFVKVESDRMPKNVLVS